MEPTSQFMKNIKTLQEKLKTYAPLMKLTTESMKNKEKIYRIQSTRAIIQKKLTCILWSLDNIKAAKNRLAHPQ